MSIKNTLKQLFGPALGTDTRAGRRGFLWKLGAGVSGALAASAGVANTEAPNREADLAQQLALAQDEKALRALHRAYEEAMDKGAVSDVLALFVDSAAVSFNGGVFKGREQGLRRLYAQHFTAGRIGRRMEAAPGFAVPAAAQQESLQVAADRRTATAVFPYSIQVGKPLESDNSLADMARLHGGAVQLWWEGGVYEVSYRRNAGDGRWMISSLAYKTLARADYRPGRSYAGAMKQSPLAAWRADERA